MRAGTNLIDTPRGSARIEVAVPDGRAKSLLVLGHGAGGEVTAPDLSALTAAALSSGVAVALITQPYRVAGRRTPAPASHLDDAWRAAVAGLDRGRLPLVVGGRSSGARVACRTAVDCGADGVVALAFPLHPPGRPERSRADELVSGLPTLVVNGDRDPFGAPQGRPGVEVVLLPGERHDLKRDPLAVAQAVLTWLRGHGWARA